MTILAVFKGAMQQTYGPFESLPFDHLANWIPPPMAEGHKGRYLWTDGFAVVNFITLYKQTSNQKYLTLASRLIHTVHDVLGRTPDGSMTVSDRELIQNRKSNIFHRSQSVPDLPLVHY
jgi:DUF1680 family protein